MKQTLTTRIARICGLGRLPAELRHQLEVESKILFLAEGVGATATLRRFRAPWVRSSWRKTVFIGCVVVTEKRLVVRAKAYHYINLNMAFSAKRFNQIAIGRTVNFISIRFDASLNGPDYSGEIEIRLHLPDQEKLMNALNQTGFAIHSE